MTPPVYNADEVLIALQGADYNFVLRQVMPLAIAGDSDAQCTIALMYEGGLGVDRNVLEAERWLRQAAKQNNALAWNNLGNLYTTRPPELKNRWDDATECFKKAAELGFGHPYP